MRAVIVWRGHVLTHVCALKPLRCSQSVKHSGIPAAHWVLAGRSEDGEKVKELQAYDFHVVSQ